MTIHYTIRKAMPADEPLLWQMLFYAAHMDADEGATIEQAQKHATLSQYVKQWGRAGDLGFVAIDTASDEGLGAVWARLFTGTGKGYSPVDEQTPELAIAVLPRVIGQGIGTALMRQFLDAASQIYPAVALNVRADNPAVRLYQRLGFRIISELTNRVGTLSYDMRIDSD